MQEQQIKDKISALQPSYRERVWMFFAVVLTSLFALILVLFLAGFALFVHKSIIIEQPQDSVKVDGIIVLTGGRARLETGFSLLEKRPGIRLLISGVSPLITDRENLAEILGLEPSFLECCVDLGREAVNTKGNADESAIWVKKNGYKKVLIVTNRYHLLRSLAELHHTMPHIALVPFPVERGNLFQSSESLRLFASEYMKYLIVRFRNFFD